MLIENLSVFYLKEKKGKKYTRLSQRIAGIVPMKKITP